MKRIPVTIAAVALAVLAAAGCTKAASSGAGPETSAIAGSASARYSSAMANPTVAADAAQAKAIVKQCITGTPLQQAHTIHLVFLSSATGKHGPEVVTARTQVFGCMGIPASQRTSFANDAATAAEHGKLYTKAGFKTYAEVTLPGLVAKYRAMNGAASPSPATSGA